MDYCKERDMRKNVFLAYMVLFCILPEDYLLLQFPFEFLQTQKFLHPVPCKVCAVQNIKIHKFNLNVSTVLRRK